MHITNRPWVITTIAAVTILFSIGPLFGSLFAIVSSLGQVLLNPFFLVVLVSSVVTTAAGIGLLSLSSLAAWLLRVFGYDRSNPPLQRDAPPAGRLRAPELAR